MMSASTLLVTVSGLFKPIDLELPGDVPVGELIPLLLEICASQENDAKKVFQAPISLHIEGISTPLPPERTLADAGICDGAVLILQAIHFSSIQTERFTPRNLRYNR